MGQISKAFKKQLSKVRLNMLCYENAELKTPWHIPMSLQVKAAASFLIKYPLSISFQPKVIVLSLAADVQQ